MAVDKLFVSRGPLAPDGKTWLRLAASARRPGAPDLNRTETLTLDLTRLDRKSPAQRITLVGISPGRNAVFPMSGDIPLAPGRYRLAVPAGTIPPFFFELGGTPNSPLRTLCGHDGPAPSYIEGNGGYLGTGVYAGSFAHRFTAACCRPAFLKRRGRLPNQGALFLTYPDANPLLFTIGTRTFRVAPGSYLLIDPGAWGAPSRRTPFPMSSRQVSISAAGLEQARKAIGLPEDIPFGFDPEPRPVTPELDAAITAFADALARTESLAGPAVVQAALLHLVLLLVDIHPNRLPRRAAGERLRAVDPRLKAAVEHLRRHYDEPFDRLALARAACVSDQHLRRLFQRQLHKSPHEALQEIRVDAAKQLLADPEIKVDEVARRVGYRDARTFRRVFQRVTARRLREFRPA